MTFCFQSSGETGPSINARPKQKSSSSVTLIYISYYSPLPNKNRTKPQFATEAGPNNGTTVVNVSVWVGEVQHKPESSLTAHCL